jgi:3-oxoacid CoA-transferase subunit A
VAGKLVESAAEAIAGIGDGAVIAVGGFGLCGVPERTIEAIHASGARDLTVISNNCGIDDGGLGLLLASRQISKVFASFVGENQIFARQLLDGAIEVELVPQGTLAERLRAAGAGIAAFYVPAGVGTPLAEGREMREFAGRSCMLEHALAADFALVKAWKGDSFGNLVYHATARNFNPLMATAGSVTIAEVEELVPLGALDPDQIHTPGVYVQRVLVGADYEKRIEHRVVRGSGKA